MPSTASLRLCATALKSSPSVLRSMPSSASLRLCVKIISLRPPCLCASVVNHHPFLLPLRALRAFVVKHLTFFIFFVNFPLALPSPIAVNYTRRKKVGSFPRVRRRSRYVEKHGVFKEKGRSAQADPRQDGRDRGAPGPPRNSGWSVYSFVVIRCTRCNIREIEAGRKHHGTTRPGDSGRANGRRGIWPHPPPDRKTPTLGRMRAKDRVAADRVRLHA